MIEPRLLICALLLQGVLLGCSKGDQVLTKQGHYESLLPADSQNVIRTQQGQWEQISFSAQRKFPAFAFNGERIGSLANEGWTRCKSSADDWSSFMDVTSGSPVRIYQRILHFKKSDEVLMIVGRYTSVTSATIAPGMEAPPDSETQNGAIIVMKGTPAELNEALKTFNARC
jgi:hypothetical protein